MNEKKPTPSFVSLRVQVVALVAILSVLALWGMHRTMVLLNGTLERTVARQAADMSVIAQERFDRELSELTLAANHLAMASTEEDTTRLLASLRGTTGGRSVGLLTIRGEAIQGAALSRWKYPSLSRAFRGQSVIDYCLGRGLLFAVPVIRNGNVRAVLYRLYDDKGLTDRFTLTDYNPAVRLLILDRLGNLIIPYKNYGESDKEFFNAPEIRQEFWNLREQLDTSRSAASYIERNGERYFIFASDLPKANCTVAGYIPWSAVAGDISRIHERLLRSIGVLLLIFFAVGRYIFSVRRKAAENDALRREKAAANMANRAKSDFLANMSHEIRTPINAVLGMNEMVLREGKDPAVIRYARNIRSAGQTLLDIINDILDFSKIESGKLEIVEGAYRLSDLIGNAVNMTKPRAESKGLSFGLDVDTSLPDALVGDMTRVQQIVVNLLTNAAKYTETGSVDLRVSGERDAVGEFLMLRFEIRDTGIGIRDEDKGRLFKGFERLDGVRNRSIEGTGLGLAITKRLATLMGGDVVFESTYGVGSVFTATLPQKIAGDAPIGDLMARLSGEAEEPAYRASFTAPSAHILVVDDNELNLLVVEGLLKATGLQIDAVTDGQSALDCLASKRYDAVLLDHRMPGMDGVETLRAAKTLPNAEGVPFLVLTADAVAGAKEKFLETGFDDYLAKPLDGEALEQTLIHYLPKEKVTRTPQPEKAEDDLPQDERTAANVQCAETGDDFPMLDVDLALQYCNNISFYRKIAGLFVGTHPKKRALIEEAFANENWKNYTSFIHALKSSSLSIGGKRLSETAKAVEASGKILFDANAGVKERADALDYVRSHHARMMALYDEFAECVRDDLARRA